MRTTLLSLSLVLAATTVSAETLKVVSSFSILGDLTAQVGGDKIDHSVLVGSDEDVHVFQPTPQDAKTLAEADIVFVNGLDFEGWLDRLIDASGFDGEIITVSSHIDPIAFGEEDLDDHGDEGHDDHDDHAEEGHDDHAEEGHDDHDEEGHDDHDDHAGHDHGEFDPHAWHNADLAAHYVEEITEALAEADAANADFYEANGEALEADLVALDAEIKQQFANIPEGNRVVITSHDAFQYYGQAYGIEFLAPVGLGTEDKPSAKEVADLIVQIRDRGVTALFVESIVDTRLIELIADETGAKVGGTLYSGSLSDETGPASAYQDMMRHNTKLIAEAFRSGS